MYGYDPEIKVIYAKTIEELKKADELIFNLFISDAEKIIFAFEGKRDKYQTAMLGNQLRTLSDKYKKMGSDKFGEITRDLIKYLELLIKLKNTDILKN